MSVPWTLVLPVKALRVAKSRLDAPTAEARAELALAFALDTVGAVLDLREVGLVSDVVVVSSEKRVAAVLAGMGVRLVPDPAAGLVEALRAGIGSAQPGPVAVLLADLPALRAAELGAALDAASAVALGMVPDEAGSGTTLLTALDGARLVPRFGQGSRAAHEAAGHAVLDAGPGLRRDVDTTEDLAAAIRLGVGPFTASALAAMVPLD